MWGFTSIFRRLGRDFGFAPAVIAASVLMYAVALLVDPQGIGGSGLMTLLAPSPKSLFLLGASGSLPVFDLGRWWTVLSASFLHAGLLHIAFNMWWVKDLAPATASAYGPARMVIIYIASGASGFALSSLIGHFLPFLPRFLGGAHFTVGASAAVFGLLGALVRYGQKRGSSALGQQALRWAAIMVLFGFVMPGIDNWAHIGGFAGGWACAAWLNPWKEERTDHVVAAFVLLAASIAAVVASVLTALPALI